MSRDRKARRRAIRIKWGQRDYPSKIILYATFLKVSFPFPSAWNGDDVLALHSSAWCGILARNHHAVGSARNQNPIIEGVSNILNSDQRRRRGT